MDRFFRFYDRSVKIFAVLSLLFMMLYFALWILLNGGITGALYRLMTGEAQQPSGEYGYLHLQKDNPPSASLEEPPELIL